MANQAQLGGWVLKARVLGSSHWVRCVSPTGGAGTPGTLCGSGHSGSAYREDSRFWLGRREEEGRLGAGSPRDGAQAGCLAENRVCSLDQDTPFVFGERDIPQSQKLSHASYTELPLCLCWLQSRRQKLGMYGQAVSPEHQILRFKGNLEHKSTSQTGPYGFTGSV